MLQKCHPQFSLSHPTFALPMSTVKKKKLFFMSYYIHTGIGSLMGEAINSLSGGREAALSAKYIAFRILETKLDTGR